MKKKDSRLTKEKYAQLKNRIYKIYLSDIEHPEENKIEKMFAAIAKFNNETLNEIVADTVEFPFDKELFAFYKRNLSMSLDDFVVTMSNLFGITQELAVSKIREYMSYNFENLENAGLIDKEYVDGISALYVKLNNKSKNK